MRHSAIGIADAVGANNEQSKRRHVYVSVYILLGGSTSDALLSSLTGGGLYHSGIEIEGFEYAFGGGRGGGSGVCCHLPRALPPGFRNVSSASYKESLNMGMTRPLTLTELHRMIVDMRREWRKDDYSMLRRNWCVAREASQLPHERPAGRRCSPSHTAVGRTRAHLGAQRVPLCGTSQLRFYSRRKRSQACFHRSLSPLPPSPSRILPPLAASRARSTPRSHNFTAAACARLGVAAPPNWLNSLAQTAASSASMFGIMREPPAAQRQPPARLLRRISGLEKAADRGISPSAVHRRRTAGCNAEPRERRPPEPAGLPRELTCAVAPPTAEA